MNPKLAKNIAKRTASQKTTEPVWKGPEDSGPQGGVTQSLLSGYLACPERFRIATVLGLRPNDQFNKAQEFGNMWHIAEEVFAGSGNPIVSNPVSDPPWLRSVRDCARDLANRYPLAIDEVNKWFNVVKIQFPLYMNHWKNHPDQQKRIPLMQEVSFRVPYDLPSGRTAWLRGKWDSIDLIGPKGRESVWLTDHKTKGSPDRRQIERQLTFDIQTMTYLSALNTLFRLSKNGANHGVEIESIVPTGEYFGNLPLDLNRHRIGGIIYNVVRRPLSGGKGSIVQHKPTKSNPAGESAEEYYGRLRDVIAESADDFFMRWKVDISEDDIWNFETQTLIPVLENLCDDYEWWSRCLETGYSVFSDHLRADTFNHRRRHYRLPYGVYNVIAEGGSSDLDEYLATGQTVGLRRVDSVFPEL